MPTLHAFDGATLEEALARVTAEVGRGARITQAEKVRTGGVAGFFARERFEVTVEVDESTEPAATAPAPEAPAPAAEPEPVRSLLDLVAEADDAEQAPVAHAPSTEGRTFQEVLRSIAADAGLTSTAIAPAPAPELPVLDPEPVAQASVPEARTDEVDEMLVALGVPAELLAAAPAEPSVAQHLLRALEGIPQAEPVLARRGEVVVVVGDEAVALRAAGQLAAQLGLDAADVVVAGPDQHGIGALATAEDAERQASLWRSCGAPFVVAVCQPAGAAGVSWARAMVEALDPVVLWAAVRADRKPDDVASSARQLGAVDALAVGGCADTCSPAAVLAAGIPVAVVEGRRATPAAWTALLVERLVP